MKYKTILAIAILIVAISSYSVIATKDGNNLPIQENNGTKQGKEVGILGVPNPISGNIFEGNYIRVGINDLGTLGVTNGPIVDDPGVGFQSASDVPFQYPTTESTAVGWWGEGYAISYVNNVVGNTCSSCKTAYFQPGFGWPCDGCNIQPISSSVSIAGTEKEVKVKTVDDGNLTITFRFIMKRNSPLLYLETTLKNVGTLPMIVAYKRMADWDVCSDANNNWASTATDAYAWGYCGPLNRMVQLTMSGHDGGYNLPNKFVQSGVYNTSIPIVEYVDLNAWDDMTRHNVVDTVQSYVPISGDYNAGILYRIGELRPGESKIVYTVYQSNFPNIN